MNWITRNYNDTRSLQTLAASLLISTTNLVGAEELFFPTTAAEIVHALTPKSSLTRGLGTIEEDVVPKAAALIGFEKNSAIIEKDYYPLLHEYAKALQGGLADAALEIAGHADSLGQDDYNRKLSERRAMAVKDFLVYAYDISNNRLTAKGYGESKPIDSNDSEKGRLRNRRVEFIRADKP